MKIEPTFDPAAEHSSRWVRTVIHTLSHPGATWVVLAVCLVATALVSLHARQQEQARAQVRFSARTEALQNSIVERLKHYLQVLRGAGGLFAASVTVQRREWQSYVGSLDLAGRYPGLLTLSFVENVAATNLPAFLDRARSDTAGQFQPAEFHLWPATSHTNHFVVKYAEPHASNRRALGYDIGSEAARREAAEWARDTGRAAITGKINLVQAPQKPGVLLVLPIYRNGSPTATAEERRSALEGWVNGAFVVEDLLAGVRRLTGFDLEFEIFDGTEISPHTRLLGKEASPADAQTRPPGSATFERTTTIPFENRVWTLRFRAPPDLLDRAAGFSSVAFLASCGLCISLLIFGIARSMATTGRRAVTLACQMTERLRLEERAMSSSSDGIFILDAERERCPILYANPAFVKLTGHAAEGHLGDETLNMLRGGTNLTELANLRPRPPIDRPARTVVREYRNGGSPSWIQFSLSSVRDERGRTTHYVGIAEDITERRRAEQSLQESEAKFRALFESSRDAIMLLDRKGFTDCNQATLDLFGCPAKDQFILKHPAELSPPCQADRTSSWTMARDRIEAAYAQGSQFFEWRHQRLDGTVFPAEVLLSRFELHGKTVLQAVVRDITERRRSELAIRESQERLALVIQGSRDGIWDWNVFTNEVYFSPRWKSMLGYAEHELKDNFPTWEHLLHPDDLVLARATLQEYFLGSRAQYELEHRLRHKDGSYRWILARGVALRNDAGKPIRMAGSHVDLTERKLAEEELRRTCVQLSQSQADLERTVEQLRASHAELEKTQLELIQAAKLESMGTLAASVAHEVKNPLQTVLMGLEYLARNLPHCDENTIIALTDMNDAVKRADGIVREMLHFSAATKFNFQEQPLNAMVTRALWLVNTQLVAARINVELSLADALPPVWIDRGKIEQVLLNLFINAHQAMTQNGTLTIRTRAGQFGDLQPLNPASRSRFKPADPVVIVEIQDTGSGIPEAQLSRIFDLFFTTKPVGVGTGLGLSVVKKIVDLHEGAIEMRNVPQGGALAILVFKAINKGLL